VKTTGTTSQVIPTPLKYSCGSGYSAAGNYGRGGCKLNIV